MVLKIALAALSTLPGLGGRPSRPAASNFF